MTVPFAYAHASEQFDRFLDELRVRYDHTTGHQAYQTLEGVLRVFRRRLTPSEGLRFADALPAVLRAVFVADWNLDEPLRPFGDLAEMNSEVRQYRPHHNLTPPDAIEVFADVLRRYVDPVHFRRALASLPPAAASFWGVED